MTTTCQTIVTRATSANPLNAVLATDRAEMLSRIRADQQEIFTQTAAVTRDRFLTTAPLTSSNAGSGRTFDLSEITPVLERIVKIVLPDGRELSQVDILDIEAELAPRYTVRGQTLVEVGNDWSTTSGIVTAEMAYVHGMTDIDPTGALTQTVSVPDTWIDLLVLPLRMYFFLKDPGRDPLEHSRLEDLLGYWGDDPKKPRSGRRGAYLSYLETYGGVESRRFEQPSTGRKR